MLASLQGSSLVIALPDVLTGLGATFLTIMWVLLGYLLITTALVPVVGRLADMFGRKNLYVAGFAVFTLGSLLAALASALRPSHTPRERGAGREAENGGQSDPKPPEACGCVRVTAAGPRKRG